MTLTLFQALLLNLFPALLIFAGLKDATSYTIPNWISAALVVGFFPTALAIGLTPTQIGLSAAVATAILLAGMGMFAVGWDGGGDAKLLAAASLWLGIPALLTFLLMTGLFGGCLAMALLGLRSGWVRPFMSRAPNWLGRLITPGADVPYGVAIAAGALAAFPQSALMENFRGTF